MNFTQPLQRRQHPARKFIPVALAILTYRFYFELTIVALGSGLALIEAAILIFSLACGDLAERVIEATGTLSAFSHRASGHIRYERIARLAPKHSKY